MPDIPDANRDQTHFEVLGLDEAATLVRRQIEEAYEARSGQCAARLAEVAAESEEAGALRRRLAQLNAARAVLVPRKARDEYRQQLGRLRESERELERATGRKDDGGRGSSAVLVLHLRQQVERGREEVRRLHERQWKPFAEGTGADDAHAAEDQETPGERQTRRRRTARFGPRAAAVAELAARRPVRRR